MRITLENKYITAEIESFGAELKSLKSKANNQEYMWEADKKYWGKTAPILFPFIGKLQDGGFRHGGKFYEMTKHGFARDNEFEVLPGENGESAAFSFESNEETKGIFPFDFCLKLEYILQGKKLIEKISVTNKGQEVMYFNIGAHPAFACPQVINGERRGTRNDCSVRIYSSENKSAFDITKIDINTGLLPGEKYPLDTDNGNFEIKDHIFDSDALVFENQGVNGAGFVNAEGKEFVRLESDDCPVWGIWSMPVNEASYVCIEPWWGICDKAGYDGELKDRPYTNMVDPGETWERELTISLNIDEFNHKSLPKKKSKNIHEKKWYKIARIVVCLVLALAAGTYVYGKVSGKDDAKESEYQQSSYEYLDELYNNKDYTTLMDYTLSSYRKGHDLTSWSHYEFCSMYQLKEDIDFWRDDVLNGRKELTAYQWLFYNEWCMIGQSLEYVFDENETEEFESYVVLAKEDMTNIFGLSDEEIDSYIDEISQGDYFIPYTDCAEIIDEDWYEEHNSQEN